MKDGGPAFPTKWVNDSDINLSAPNGAVVPPGGEEHLPGMTLRDYFAAKAMQGNISSVQEGEVVIPDRLARWSYEMADAMLKARGK